VFDLVGCTVPGVFAAGHQLCIHSFVSCIVLWSCLFFKLMIGGPVYVLWQITVVDTHVYKDVS
jgi:hypothetical protein